VDNHSRPPATGRGSSFCRGAPVWFTDPVRPTWEQVPARVRAAVEAWLGGPVVAAQSHGGGFSPGLAATLTCADGRRLFAKAVGPEPNESSPRLHRREARVAAALPVSAPAPRLLATIDEGDGGWVTLLFEAVEGRQPAVPWQAEELERVTSALAALSASLTPSPLSAEEVGRAGERWRPVSRGGFRALLAGTPPGLDAWSRRHLARLAELEAGAAEAARGDTLLHLDLRDDNILLAGDGVVVVDWPHARVGAAVLDPVFMAPSVAMQGGPEPEALLARLPAGRAAASADVTAIVAAVAGFFTFEALQPPPPGLPTLRAFQEAQAVVARRWLADRSGLE
jgi:aminoglycoside phosphotransferase (APT) family kinase protein